ncbi:MAG TPA: hypothetical protein DCS55_07940, partial [Acidimicrobiaceae bacterium]|nr:hypothetical protein [Acidimicrobiaceae bacterium]
MGRWQRATTVGLALVAISLLALAGIHNQLHGPRVRDSIEATRIVRTTHEAMLDMQGGLRAYALTGDERFLQAYQDARRVMERMDATVLPVDDDVSRLHLELRLSQAAWLNGWVPEALALGEAGGSDGVLSEALVFEGKQLFDAYRTDHAALIGALQAERADAIDGQTEAVTRTAALAVVMAFATAAFSLVQGRRLRDDVRDGLDAIQLRLDRVAAGDLQPGPVPSGPAELAGIQRGIDVTAAELASARAEVDVQGDQLRTQNRQLGQVLRFAREVAGSLNLRYVIRGLCAAATNITASDRVVVWLRSTDEQTLEAVADSSAPALEPIGLE